MLIPSILSIRNVTKTFTSGDRTLTVLNNISFSLQAGTSCSIVGPSGSGKTTLLGLCAGLDLPTSGSILFDGKLITDVDEETRAQIRRTSVGFIFQNFQLIPTLSAVENVMVPLELLGDGGRAKKFALDLLDRVGLKERAHHYPAQLSGGEQQRVALARAFVHRPKILFVDEPIGNLDQENSHLVTQLLFELNKKAGTTLVVVTHNLALAERTDQIIRLKGGNIMLSG